MGVGVWGGESEKMSERVLVVGEAVGVVGEGDREGGVEGGVEDIFGLGEG